MWLHKEESMDFLNIFIFPYLKKVKEEKGYLNEQHSVVILETFKGQENDILKSFVLKINAKS